MSTEVLIKNEVADADTSSDDDEFPEHSSRRTESRHCPFLLSLALPWALSGILLVSLVFVAARNSAVHCKTRPDDQGGLYSPAEDAVEYVPVVFKLGSGSSVSQYQGFPTDETDRLWEELYAGKTTIRDAQASKALMLLVDGAFLRIDQAAGDRLLNKSVRAPINGYENDYMVGLDVFHQLHCLNQIRQAFYPKRYDKFMVNADGTVNYLRWLHIDHCIESVRQSLMCHSDNSLVTYKWVESKKMTEPEMKSVHFCRNFDRIRSWATQRALNFTNKRVHVEDGAIVDYTHWGPDPEAAAERFSPQGWNYTVEDL